MGEPHPRSTLLGLIGARIGASLSPALHESEGRECGLQLVYRLIDFKQLGLEIPDLAALLKDAEKLGYDGFNVTHPYKTAILPLLNSLSPAAQAIGAANTVVLRDGQRFGYNTDWEGFAESIRHGLPGVAVRHVAQIGAGGAGAATAYAMLMLGTQRVLIYDLDPSRARALADKLQEQFPDREVRAAGQAAEALAGADGAVLATPVGMRDYPGTPFDPGLLSTSMWVADVIYAPPETEILAHARRLGCRTLNGSGMLSFQAAKAFHLFTGVKPDADRMLRSLERVAPGVTQSRGTTGAPI
jgi:shikimate dehydrogenase